MHIAILALYILFFGKIFVNSQPTNGVLNSKLSVLSLKRHGPPLENELSHFTTEKRGAFDCELVVKFKPAVKCTRVKYDGLDVWTFTKHGGHPKTVTLNTTLKTLWVSFDEFDFLTFKHIGAAWVYNRGLSVGAHSNYKQPEVHVEDEVTPLDLVKSVPNPIALLEDLTTRKKAAEIKAGDFTPGGSPRAGIAAPDTLDSPSPRSDSQASTPDSSVPPELGGDASPESLKPSQGLTFVPLDISLTKETEYFDYEHVLERNDHIYTAKEGYSFSKIVKGTHTLLEYSPKAAHKVEVNFFDGDIMTYSYCFGDRSFFVDIFQDPDPAQENEEPAPTSRTSLTVLSDAGFYSDYLKLLTTSDKTFEDDVTHYQVEDLTNFLNYSFNKNSKCTEVKYNQWSLWKHDRSKHGEHYPTNVLLNMKTKFLLVESEGQYQYFYSFIDGNWRSVFGYVSLRPLDRSRLTVMTLNDRVLAIENDATQFDVEENKNTIKFVFKPGAKCIAVKYEHAYLWRYSIIDHDEYYPTTVTLNTERNFLMVDSTAKYRHYYSYYDGKWKSVFGYKSKSSDAVNFRFLKVYTEDESGNAVANDSTKFDVEKDTNSKSFIFHKDSKCTEVVYDEKTVWKFERTMHNDKYPTLVMLNKKNSNLLVECADEYLSLFTFRGNEWSPTPFGFRPKRMVISQLKILTQNEDGTFSENDNAKYTLEPSTNLFTFKLAEDAKCTEVIYDSVSVWKHDPGDHGEHYPDTLIFNTATSFLIVEAEEKYQYFYSYYNGEWKCVFGYKANLVATEDELDHLKFNNLKLYTLNDDGTTAENDTNTYDVEEYSGLFTLNFKPQSKCTEVRYEDNSVWKYVDHKYLNKYPTTLVMNTNNGMVTVQSSSDYLHFFSFYNNKWTPVYGFSRKASVSTNGDTAEDSELSTTQNLSDDEMNNVDISDVHGSEGPDGETDADKAEQPKSEESGAQEAGVSEGEGSVHLDPSVKATTWSKQVMVTKR